MTTTTHKSLRGPRAGMIFFRRGPKASGGEYDYEDKINFSVFPSLQGGPHNHQIAGLATQLKEVATPEFKSYCQQVKANAAALAKFLVSKQYKLCTDVAFRDGEDWATRAFKDNTSLQRQGNTSLAGKLISEQSQWTHKQCKLACRL